MLGWKKGQFSVSFLSECLLGHYIRFLLLHLGYWKSWLLFGFEEMQIVSTRDMKSLWNYNGISCANN